MASRPLPPGRRGRPIRGTSAQALNNLPEVKLLDTSDSQRNLAVTTADTKPVRESPPRAPRCESTPASELEDRTVEEAPAAAKLSVSEGIAAREVSSPASLSVVEPAQPLPATLFCLEDTQAFEESNEQSTLSSASGKHGCIDASVSNGEASAGLMGATDFRSTSSPSEPASAPPPQPLIADPVKLHHDGAASRHNEREMTADAPAARSNTPETDASAGDNFELSPYHPYHLLLPIDHVPEVPGTVECLFDDDAVKMQKTILKVVKKLLQKDKFKIEDFKINAKLYGNSFMEPHEYVEYLATDFGGIRALQIVPSLLLIQPDHLKQSSLLVAAQNYRVRNLAKLENAIARAPKPSETVAGTSKPVTHEVPVMPVVPVAPVAPTIPDAPQAIEAPTSAVAVAAPVVAPVVAATLIAACSTSNEETTNSSNPSANADSTTDIPAVSLEQTPSQDDINHVGVKTSGSAHIRDHLSEVSGTVEPASVQQLPRLSEPIAFSEQTYGVAELSIAGTSAPPASLTATGNLFGESFSEEPVSTPSPAEVAMSQSSVDVTDASVGSTSSEATPSIDIADFAADGNLFGDATSGDSTSPGVNLFGEALELNSGNLATSSTGVSQPMMAGTSTTPEPSTASGPAAPAFGRTSLFGFAAGAATDSDSDSDFSD